MLAAGLSSRTEKLGAVLEAVLCQPNPVVDFRDIFGRHGRKELLLSDGLQPSLAGQKTISRSLVRMLAQLFR
ncbi:lysophospholipase L1 and related esterase-like protein [Truepera radiovictrix DSM 17093]|uniref:Lysophospholipase L1 and related esterase-like protein n=1 Tax=Truepera radiovictrix (strain DSM 17093 / CIP 108686 / LMG 22925 / RQ-24) TaxID=649638 RepID=D7CQF5_TRURR|nr:lysophospholipase L1 and related esterase-like protein [Truepera radiovictrix DSM 17093]